jgi:exopolysaccharide biosynthesis polyprenyl glycosylphosphotransferase
MSDSADAPANASRNALSIFVPGPLQGRMGLKWLQSTTVDFALVALSWLILGAVLAWLRQLSPLRGYERFTHIPAPLLGAAVMHAALVTMVTYIEGLQVECSGLRSQVCVLGKSVLWATSVLCLAAGLQGLTWVASGVFCAAGLMSFGTLSVWRWCEKERGCATRERGDTRNVLIVGSGKVGRQVASYVEQHPATKRIVRGFLDDDGPLGDGVIGRIADLARTARREFVDEVILAAPRTGETTRWVVEEARRLRLDVEIVPDLCGCSPAESPMERLGDAPVICLHAERLPSAGLVMKRLVDVAGAGTALILLAPLLAVIATLIKLDSRGAVFYRAQRAGRKGRLFRCYKFRTMVGNADQLKDALRQNNERSGPFFKMTGDPRVTRFGRILRRYSLDELPQLWNVARGEMSLVGPRPHPLDDVAGYEIEHLGRLDVTPGITGLWQVTARRDPSFHRGMELDREYIRRWSLTLDLQILLRTFRAVLCGDGQ